MSIEEPYGELITSTLDIATWNLWGRFGPWEQRHDRIVDTSLQHPVDVLVLQESWTTPDGGSQAELLGQALGLGHWFVGLPGPDHGGWHPASAIVSRWPIDRPHHRSFEAVEDVRGWPGQVVAATVVGPRGRVPVIGVALDWPPHGGPTRLVAVRQLAALCRELGRAEAYPVVVCGDFNAGPDSAELRALTGLDAPAAPGFVLFDAWTTAGQGPGITWDRTNRWAMPTLLASRRIDFILTGWPSQPGGGGDVLRVRVIGDDDPEHPPSDHYAVSARLRY